MTLSKGILTIALTLLTGIGTSIAQDRTVLPIADPVFPKITELDARNAVAPPPFSITTPEGAPNIVIVLIDDIGFGAASGFGGAIQTPDTVGECTGWTARPGHMGAVSRCRGFQSSK